MGKSRTDTARCTRQLMHIFKKRFLLAALIVAVLVVFLSATAASQEGTPNQAAPQQITPAPTPAPLRNGCEVLYKARYHRRYVESVYRRPVISKQARQKMIRLTKCQRTKNLERRAKKFERKQRALRRYRIALDRVTPFGNWAIPSYIVMCESGGNFRSVNTSNPNRPAGAYQIITSTWSAHGGRRFAWAADAASPLAQHIIAGRIWRSGGASQWECS